MCATPCRDWSIVRRPSWRAGALACWRRSGPTRGAAGGVAQDTDVRLQHARYYTSLAEQAEPNLRGKSRPCGYRRYFAVTTPTSVWRWIGRGGRRGSAARVQLAGALGWYWYVGRQMDGLAQLRTTLETSGGASTGAGTGAAGAVAGCTASGCIVHASNEAADATGRASRCSARRARASRPSQWLLLAVQGVAEGDMQIHLREVDLHGGCLSPTVTSGARRWPISLRWRSGFTHGAVDEAPSAGGSCAATTWLPRRLGPLRRTASSRARPETGRTHRRGGRGSTAVELSRETGLPNNLARSYVELARLPAPRRT